QSCPTRRSSDLPKNNGLMHLFHWFLFQEAVDIVIAFSPRTVGTEITAPGNRIHGEGKIVGWGIQRCPKIDRVSGELVPGIPIKDVEPPQAEMAVRRKIQELVRARERKAFPADRIDPLSQIYRFPYRTVLEYFYNVNV